MMAEEEDHKGPDEVIYELGACGRFQIRFALMIHTMNIVIVWCLGSMIFITAVPKWRRTNEQTRRKRQTKRSRKNVLCIMALKANQ